MAFFSFSFTSACVLPRTFFEDVFDAGLASFQIVTDCVPALPSTVLSFADVPFPVRSSFRHGISPFRNEQYRNQGNKATRKSNCYQKVIICRGRPIFVYCGPIFALPGAFSLVTAVQFSNGQEVLFIDYSGAKYARLALPVLRDVITSVFSKNGHKAPPKSLEHLRLRELRRQPL